MPSNPASYRGQETTAQALGRTLTFSRFDPVVWEPFLQWAKTVLPDPIDVAHEKVQRLVDAMYRIKADPDLSPDEKERRLFVNAQMQGAVTRLAMDEAMSYLSPNSTRVKALMMDQARGGPRLLMGLLKEHHPDITELDAYWIAQELSEDEIIRIVGVTQGKVGPQGNAASPAPSRGSPKPIATPSSSSGVEAVSIEQMLSSAR